jgi:hypothetical protein
MKKKEAASSKKRKSSSRQPSDKTKASSDWRPAVIARIRVLICEADPEMVEEIKWRKPSNPAGIPVWYHGGIVCTGETYKGVVKMTFAKGASLADPASLFNSKLDGSVQRAIDFHEGDKINEPALKTLIRAAVASNTGALNTGASIAPAKKPPPQKARPSKKTSQPKSRSARTKNKK